MDLFDSAIVITPVVNAIAVPNFVILFVGYKPFDIFLNHSGTILEFPS